MRDKLELEELDARVPMMLLQSHLHALRLCCLALFAQTWCATGIFCYSFLRHVLPKHACVIGVYFCTLILLCDCAHVSTQSRVLEEELKELIKQFQHKERLVKQAKERRNELKDQAKDILKRAREAINAESPDERLQDGT